jgi:hypothetical protein
MPLVFRVGDKTQGHGGGCWGPATFNEAGQDTVLADSKLIIVLGDYSNSHSTNCGDLPPSHHLITTAQGSPTVFAGGIAIVRDSDPMICGDAAETQGGSVFANGGGNVPTTLTSTASGFDGESETIGYTIAAINVTYPQITLTAEITQTLNSEGGVESQSFVRWDPTALSPKTSNGFTVTLQEEFTGQQYINYQYSGAPDLPAGAPEIYRSPFDPFIKFNLQDEPTGRFTVNNAGSLSLNSSFVPPKSNGLFVPDVVTNVRMAYERNGDQFIFVVKPVTISFNYVVVN